MDLKILKKKNISAKITIPGDKSISHRAIIFSSLAKGKSKIKSLLEADDCRKTLQIMKDLGVKIHKNSSGVYIINGVGLYGLKEPKNILDCGNSGTAMRLLTGLLSAQNFYSVLSGDNSLRQRPMERIIKPLSKMGAEICSRKGFKAPLSIKGLEANKTLKAIKYELPMASAQLKSSILLAALYAKEKTVIKEPALSRDHSERMLKAVGVDLIKDDKLITLNTAKSRTLKPLQMEIPGDISSAAFFIVAALITEESKVILENIGVNYTRSGFLDIIKEMGANIEIINKRKNGGEEVADIIVKSSNLNAININGQIIPRLIDEIPIIAVLASQAKGKTVIKDAEELRVKETDRIKATVNELKKLGVNIKELADGMIINGPNKIKGGITVKSYHDHRIAMALAILALNTEKGLIIKNSEVIKTSFPQFLDIIKEI